MALAEDAADAAVSAMDRWRVRLLLERCLDAENLRLSGDGPVRESALLAEEMERACLDNAERVRADYRREDAVLAGYWDAYQGLSRALGQPHGPGLMDTLAAALLKGEISPARAADPEVYQAHQYITVRPRMQGKLCGILAAAAKTSHPRLADPEAFPGGCQAMAKSIEKGVYNRAVRHCEESEDGYERSWSCPMFVAIYSARLGAVFANLDPQSAVARTTGGFWLLDRLAEKDLSPDQLGGLSEAELCPPASAACRLQIELRQSQKVTEKESTMFRCPRCKERRHTYRSVQIGSGDEASTFMCTCLNCGENFEGRG